MTVVRKKYPLSMEEVRQQILNKPEWAGVETLYDTLSHASSEWNLVLTIYGIRSFYENQPAVFLFETLRGDLEEKIQEAFIQGESLKGYLLSTVGDYFLFSRNQNLQQLAEELSGELFLKERKFLGDEIKLEFGQKLYEELHLEQEGIRRTPEGMFLPEKSMGVVFLLGDTKCSQIIQHSCKNCRMEECPYGKR